MTKSGFIRNLLKKKSDSNYLPEKIKEISDKIYSMPDEFFPPLDYVQNIGCSDLQHFRNSALNQFSEITKRFRVKEDWRVLDMGCGCGRLAFPFSEYLSDDGSYVGFDVWSDGIAWCQQHFQQQNLSFEYVHAEDNYYYQGKRRGTVNEFNLSFLESESVDLAFAVSLFTHLVKEDVVAYLHELGKVLKKGGYAYITCFIADDYFFEFRETSGRFLEANEESSGCFYAYKRQDFFAGFSLKNLRKWIRRSGLELIFYELGTWAEKPGSRGFQDLLLIRKT